MRRTTETEKAAIEALVNKGMRRSEIIRRFPQINTATVNHLIYRMRHTVSRPHKLAHAQPVAKVSSAVVPVSEIRRLHKDRGCTITQIGALLTVPYRDVIAALETP